MTPFFAGLATGFLLGAIAFGIFALVLLAFKRPAPPPTFHHRRWRSLPVVEVPPPWERENGGDLQAGILAAARAQGNSRFVWQTEQKLKQSEVGGIRYEHLGMTGHESD